MTIVDLAQYRRPTKYTLHITHHWDGTIEAFVDDVQDDERSKEAVWFALGMLVDHHRAALGEQQ